MGLKNYIAASTSFLVIFLVICFGHIDAEEEKVNSKFEENEVVRAINIFKKTVVFLGTIKGSVNRVEFLKIRDIDESGVEELFRELINNGYLDNQGNILNKFQPYFPEFKIILSEKFAKYEKEIFSILEKALKPQFFATAFLVRVQGVFHLVTAKHVVMDRKTGEIKDDNLFVFFNNKQGSYAIRSMKMTKNNFNINWVFHQDPKVDIALIPFNIDTGNDDVAVIDDNDFYPSDKLLELYEVFFLSYQPGIVPEKKICPITRGGMISLINGDNTFYIDGAAFPGNSGSPVFIKFNPIGIDQNGNPHFINIFKGLGVKFIGIIGEYLPYQEIAVSTQTERPRMIFEENTGLSKVWSVNFINQIIESSVFKDQLKRIKGDIEIEAEKNSKE